MRLELGILVLALVFSVCLMIPKVHAVDSVSIVIAGDSVGNVCALDASSGFLIWNVSVGGDARSLAASSNGEYIVIGTSTATSLLTKDGVSVWTKNLGVSPTDPLPPFQFDTRLVSISSDGKLALVAHSDGTVRLYDNIGNEVWNDGFSATSVGLAANGTGAVAGGLGGLRFYSVGDNGVWDAGDSVPSWTASGISIRNVAISSDGDFLAAGGRGDGTVRFYNASGSEIWTYMNVADRVSVDISDDGTHVVAGNDDSSDRNGAQLSCFWVGKDGVWTSQDGLPVWTFHATSSLADDVRAVRFCPNHSYIVSGGAAGYAHVYLHRLDSATPVFASTGSIYEVETVGVSFDGKYVAAAGTEDSLVHLYYTGGSTEPLWTYNATGSIRSLIIIDVFKPEIWVPPAEHALLAGAVVVGVTSGVSTLSSAMSNPESPANSKVVSKINAFFPETVKKWLADFVSSKRKLVIGERTGHSFLPTRWEIMSYVVAMSVLTFAFSYAKTTDFNEIISVLPTVLATSVVVEFAKNFSVVTLARVLGVWTEHRLWIFGLGTFLFSSLLLRVPFSSPSRVTHNSPKFTSRSLGLVSSSSVFIGLIFAALFYFFLINGFVLIGNIGLVMCLTMAFFETIPIPPMSGKDIYDWNKLLWILLFILSFVLYMLCLLLLT